MSHLGPLYVPAELSLGKYLTSFSLPKLLVGILHCLVVEAEKVWLLPVFHSAWRSYLRLLETAGLLTLIGRYPINTAIKNARSIHQCPEAICVKVVVY
jgi:hypothetical protein